MSQSNEKPEPLPQEPLPTVEPDVPIPDIVVPPFDKVDYSEGPRIIVIEPEFEIKRDGIDQILEG